MTYTTENKTRMTIDIDTDLKNQIKARASLCGMKLKDYVVNSLKNQIIEEDEDLILGKLATKADKAGYIGIKESQNLINKIMTEK